VLSTWNREFSAAVSVAIHVKVPDKSHLERCGLLPTIHTHGFPSVSGTQVTRVSELIHS
jgi:hypothetical protein